VRWMKAVDEVKQMRPRRREEHMIGSKWWPTRQLDTALHCRLAMCW
jgi:hypothetical protein